MAEPNCCRLSAQLMVKLVQAFEGSDLFDSFKIETKGAAVDRELLRNKREENLFTGVRQSYVPLSQFVLIHATHSDSRL